VSPNDDPVSPTSVNSVSVEEAVMDEKFIPSIERVGLVGTSMKWSHFQNVRPFPSLLLCVGFAWMGETMHSDLQTRGLDT
jgi:hypothetical protein